MKSKLLFCLFLLSSFTFGQVVAIQPFATGFTSPVEITHPANDSRLFVVQQGGLIRILNSNQTINATPFLNLSTLISTGGERGLLGLAFHPNYATNGFFFVNYTNTSGSTVIAKYSVSTNPNIANTTGTILMTILQPFSNHNGGTLKFGPDGFLYIGMGDGGSGGDPGNRAQNINDNLGKMLRIDVNSTVAPFYTSPSSNPYVGIAGNDEIWAIGMRNPWKFSFNRLNGDLWIGDVGQNAVEEINKVASPLPNTGLNFGWRCYEGSVAYNTSGCVPVGNLTMPVAEYQHSTGGCSITGGYFYTGSMYPNFQNKYFFADYCQNRIGYVNASNAITYSATFTGSNNFTTFGEDLNGELYIASAGGIIYKVIDSSLGISDFTNSGFSLYPNPANDFVTLKSSTSNFANKMELYDLSGKLLVSKNLELVEENTFSTTMLSKGMYMVKIETLDGTQYASKLMVK